jgi:hypothetical protein
MRYLLPIQSLANFLDCYSFEGGCTNSQLSNHLTSHQVVVEKYDAHTRRTIAHFASRALPVDHDASTKGANSPVTPPMRGKR